MNLENFNYKFKDAINILKTFNKNGFEAYFVGGCVRDFLLGKDFSDIDITTNALPEQVKNIFRKSIDTGIQHGTVTILVNGESYEVTTFRKEDEYVNHRAPDKVEFVSDLKEDLDRRDFTINAMALDSKGKLFDFHNGEVDLNNKIIKTVNDPNERFFEDALRMLRAFRFSSKLGFDIDSNTIMAIKNNAKLIEYVSIERIVNEFRKLLEGKGNNNSMQLMIDSTLNSYIPFIKDITVIEDFSKYTFCQSLYILSTLNKISTDELKKLKLSNKELKLVKEYEKIRNEFKNNNPLEIILYKYDIDNVRFICSYFKFRDISEINKVKLAITSLNDIDITSEEIIAFINRKPGPWIRELVTLLEYEILVNGLVNNRDNILDFLEKMRDNI
ncbi:CCA tRNA nucleotidyltransferase [uncultured Gemella sp.]|uniref:CCA tRNA nucleotidyltransferase n=1 Tax=uncultured Gemella sp. TaxID=254352 RepID=UPI0028D5B8BA|nr:CCA tRNA nucleotidyltransferase [uncultured Gemella sp.]